MTPVGIGAWSWGDRSGYWGYGQGYQKADNEEAFKALVDSGIGLIDTAEVRALTIPATISASLRHPVPGVLRCSRRQQLLSAQQRHQVASVLHGQLFATS